MTTKRLDLKNLVDTYYNQNHKERENTIERVKKSVKRKKGILSDMMQIVEKTLKAYHSDFYIHDVERLHKNPESSFIWIVRKNGTHLINLDNDGVYDTGMTDNEQQWLILKNSSIRIVAIYLVNQKEMNIQKIKATKIDSIIETEFKRAIAS